MEIASIILAAGQGTRMRSDLPKVLHSLLGRPMIDHVLATLVQVVPEPPVVIVGYGAEAIRRLVTLPAQYVVQEPQLGTGHAVLQAEALLRDQAELVLVSFADMPLLSADTYRRVLAAQQEHAGPFTMLTVLANDPRGFGRVLRNAMGGVEAIVEEAQATPEQLSIHELNVSLYCFRAEWLWPALKRIQLSPKGEYYLTDLVAIARQENLPVQALLLEDPGEAIGINTRQHLAEAESVLRQRVNQQWMLAGVTLIDPATTYIEPGVQIGQDTVIWPNTHLQGSTVIGEHCEVGPNTLLRNTRLGNRCKVFASVLEGALVEDDVDIGPFAHLRKGAHLASGVHMGNFGEVKNSYLGPGVKLGHFSYIGDATIGPEVNIGAGTITCNYDGEKKNPTEIGAGAFIGSDTMLVAPVKIGQKARTGAGSVVTHDVPDGALALGVPARVKRKLADRD